ncbi:DUF1329 domain-containing protein [Aromatoleum diolicum]|uniref:DUF1329 domain-containing protein n=1 Tax=Aromatoleum diolicum TaxID=75796 RepID=A0ABX1QDT5_9RHOO|nr:DUF1329 domain-containing protein [Aromatoleum diolicum]NMG76582.1 DUF1329 domain-containing protein [Aromatoleum diolicum]
MNIKYLLMGAAAATYVGVAAAAVTADEAAKLGSTLTLVGAEKAGNAGGTIPAYGGGLTSAPQGYQKGSGIRPDPFANEKPTVSIDAKNMDQHAEKLTDGTKALMKKYPSYRIDVYPTHRTAAFPKYVTDNTLKCATTAKATNGGLSLEGCHAGIPFPIPKDGFEAMWNHLTRFGGRSLVYDYKGLYVDSSGRPTLTSGGTYSADYPYWEDGKPSELLLRVKSEYKEPVRRSGEVIMIHDAINAAEKGRRAWAYLPGQRRTKLAPSLAFDTPNPSMGGSATYDDTWLFFGSMERFNFKLVGKKEMYVPYNTYKMAYQSKADDLFKPMHLNPDEVRWELHRVWVVEATLAEGKRHIYSKRVLYLDEDSWVALASDQYDLRGQLYRAGFAYMTPSYEIPAPTADMHGFYDLISGIYAMNFYTAETSGMRHVQPLPDREWAPEALAGGGVR